MLYKFAKKIAIAISISVLIISQSLVMSAEIVDLYGGQSRTLGNLTLRCLSATTTELNSSSSFNFTTYEAVLIGFLGGMITTVSVQYLMKCSKLCSIPRCCRRQSSKDIDIRVDLLSPTPPKSYRELFENLDASLISVGWGKYPVVNEDEYVVGYKYLLLGKDSNNNTQEKASLWLVKEHQGLQDRKGLLRLNKVLRSQASKIEKIEEDYKRVIAADYYEYTKQKPKGENISETSVLHQSTNGQELLGNQMLKLSSNSSSSSSSSNELSPEIHLQNFKEKFSKYTPLNAQRFFKETLELYLKNATSRFEINKAAWFAHLNCGLPASTNFDVYYFDINLRSLDKSLYE